MLLTVLISTIVYFLALIYVVYPPPPTHTQPSLFNNLSQYLRVLLRHIGIVKLKVLIAVHTETLHYCCYYNQVTIIWYIIQIKQGQGMMKSARLQSPCSYV